MAPNPRDKQPSPGSALRRAGSSSMIALEDRVVGPTRRGVRRAGVGLGRGAAWIALICGVFNLIGGALLALLTTGVLDTIGIIFVVLGVLASLFGGGLMWALGRYSRGATVKEIEGYIRRMMAHEGQADARSAARVLKLPVGQVEACAREMALRGEIERDVDPDVGIEVYRPLGWVAQQGECDDVLARPEHHGERRAMAEFDRALDNRDDTGQHLAGPSTTSAPDDAQVSVDAVEHEAEAEVRSR